MRLEELCHLIDVSSHKRFRMAKAQELQELARNSFGFAMAGDVFSTMIRLYAKHLDFLKQQVREMDRKIAEIMDTLDTPITTITGIGPTLGAYILSEIGDISRFPSAAKLALTRGSIQPCGSLVNTTASETVCPNEARLICGTLFGWRLHRRYFTIRR